MKKYSDPFSVSCWGLASAFILAVTTVEGAIVVPGANGTDGALTITENTEIDLSQAVTAAWDSDNSANAGKGVYDAEKWAVVFKYTSVNVAAGATVTFKNHGSRAPVVWLVSGDVVIDGVVRLNGQNFVQAPKLAEPGPGGFRGGMQHFSANASDGAGFGIGGGRRRAGNGGDNVNTHYGGGGAHLVEPRNSGGSAYGNPSLLPLVGGSGAGGTSAAAAYRYQRSGGAGGGAFLIAAEGVVAIEGSVEANGGSPPPGSGNDRASGSGGSGGGVRMISSQFSGSGEIRCLAGEKATYGNAGSDGRVRLERVSNAGSVSVLPDPSVVDLSDGATALIWPPAGSPEVKIVSIGGEASPSDPRAAFGTEGADVAIPVVDHTQVVIETTGVEAASQVKVRITPRDSANFSVRDAVLDPATTEDPLRWTATIPTTLGYSAVQVQVIRP